jgi:hypothetical protein
MCIMCIMCIYMYSNVMFCIVFRACMPPLEGTRDYVPIGFFFVMSYRTCGRR